MQDQPRVGLIPHPHVPLMLQRPNDLLRVMGIHLAAKRLDIESLLHTPSISFVQLLHRVPHLRDSFIVAKVGELGAPFMRAFAHEWDSVSTQSATVTAPPVCDGDVSG